MTARLMILNGPNLNLLGVREPHIYGSTTLSAIRASCEEFAKAANAQLSFHQSNHEGALVDLIQAAREEARWAIARKMADEIAAEAGVTDEDRAWARSVLGLDSDD